MGCVSSNTAAAQPAAAAATAASSKPSSVLVIRASPRASGHSNKVTDEFLKNLKSKSPSSKIVEWHLEEKMDIPEFRQALINGRGAAGTAEEKALASQGQKIIDEFKSFDFYVVAAPMWNFAVTPKLKNLIDVLLVTGQTFEYVDGAPKGLLVNKRVIFILAHMGQYPKGGLDNDFQLPYLQFVWKLMGVQEQKSIAIDFSFKGDEADVKPLEEARTLAKNWA